MQLFLDDDIHLSTDGRRSVDNDNGERRNQFEMEFLGKTTPVTSSALEKWLFSKYKKCSNALEKMIIFETQEMLEEKKTNSRHLPQR